MFTTTKIVIASILILGSASVANAEDPEADVYHLRRPSVGSYWRPSAGSYSRRYLLPYASVNDRQTYWRKRSNSH
jgi:hypothetical protein